MNRLFARALSALGIVVVAACHSTVDPLTPDSACDDYLGAFTARSASCNDGVNPFGNDKGRFHQACVSALAAPGTGLTPQWLVGCATAMKSASCDSVPFSVPACKTPAGRLADGAGCSGDDQCQATSFCKLTQTTPSGTITDTGRCGMCAPRAADGADCSGECMADSTCSAGVCKKIVYGDVGAACAIGSDAQCKPGLSCDFQSKTCQAPGGAGAACTSFVGCTHDFACVDKTCVARQGEGAACDPSQPTCAHALACAKATSKCTRRVLAKSGEACDGTVVLCEVGLCSTVLGPPGTTGTCPTFLADGAACDKTKRDTMCSSYASCVDGTCQMRNRSACK